MQCNISIEHEETTGVQHNEEQEQEKKKGREKKRPVFIYPQHYIIQAKPERKIKKKINQQCHRKSYATNTHRAEQISNSKE